MFLEYTILFALKKRGGCPLEIFACVFYFFGTLVWPSKNPFLIVFFLYIN